VSHLDLSRPPPDHQFKVSVERAETSSERFVRLTKDLALFLVALGFVIVLAWLCIATITSTVASAEEKKWAMSILSAAAGGIIGYLLKR